jgi:hypothetical protein
MGEEPSPMAEVTRRLTTPAWARASGLVVLSVLSACVPAALLAVFPPAAVALWVGLLGLWWAARRLDRAVFAIFVFVPLGRLTWLDSTGSLDATKFVVAGLFLVWVVTSLLRKESRLVLVWTESAVTVFALLFLLANLVSILDSYQPLRSLNSIFRMTSLFVMYALVAAMVRTKRDVKIVIGILLLTGLAICLLGVWEATTHQYLWYLRGQERPIAPGAEQAITGSHLATAEAGATRVITVFVDYNFMGGYMAILMGIVGGCIMAWRNWYARAALLGLAGLVLVNAALTGSRGGVVGVAVTCVMLLLLSPWRLRWALLAALLMAMLAAFPVLDQVAPQFSRGGIGVSELEGARIGFWRMALRMGWDHPVIGAGADNFVSRYPFYRASPAPMGRWYAHNIYLQMWAEGGIVGLLALLSLVAAVALSYREAWRRATDGQWRSLVAGLLAAFLGYAVFAASCNCLHDQPFWLMMALSAVVLQAGRQVAKPGESGAPRAVEGEGAGPTPVV